MPDSTAPADWSCTSPPPVPDCFDLDLTGGALPDYREDILDRL